MLIPSRARTRLRPSVSWWHVIVMLERHGYTHAAIAGAIGSKRTTILNWKNMGQEPSHQIGESLIDLWCSVEQKRRDDLPMRVGRTLSAAQFR